MKGYLKIKTIGTNEEGMQGLKCECNMEDVSIIDKIQIVYSTTKALHMSKYEVEIFMEMYRAGILDEANITEPEEPGSVRQARESDAQVLEFDTLDDFIAHIMGGKKR